MAIYDTPDNNDADNIQIDLNEKAPQKKPEVQEPEIELIDDTPEQDRGRRPRDPNFKSQVPDDDEIGKYTKGVQDRLRTMAYEFHDERRAKEAALRENEQAIGFAKRMLEQNKKLQEALTQGHKTLQETGKKSAENEITVIRSAMSQALLAGDNDKIAELNEKMSRATARAEAMDHIQPLNLPAPEEYKPAPPLQQRPQVQLTETNQNWMERNQWFGKDQRMTAVAMAEHERLIRDGVRPESKAYYDGVDGAMRETFPDKFQNPDDGQSRQRPRSVVAPTTRSPARSAGKVTLTLSEQRVAEKLGVPLKVYAAEKLARMEQSNG